MATSLILVNGLPGSGKTTLSRQLAEALSVPVLSKDAPKEMLADIAGANVAGGRPGRIASETMWQPAASIPGTVIVESWWYRPRDLEYVAKGIARPGSPDVVEIWCEIDPKLARDRYESRGRHKIHSMGAAATAWPTGRHMQFPCPSARQSRWTHRSPFTLPGSGNSWRWPWADNRFEGRCWGP